MDLDDWDTDTGSTGQSKISTGMGETIATKNHSTLSSSITNEQGTYHLQDNALDQTTIKNDITEGMETVGYMKEDPLGSPALYNADHEQIGTVGQDGNIEKLASYNDPLTLADRASFQAFKFHNAEDGE